MREIKVYESQGYTIDDLEPNDKWAFSTLVMFANDVVNRPTEEFVMVDEDTILGKLTMEIADETLESVHDYMEICLRDILISWIESDKCIAYEEGQNE